MATWRNGSAFGFDAEWYQKVAGSSPAVVNNLYLAESFSFCFFGPEAVEGGMYNRLQNILDKDS